MKKKNIGKYMRFLVLFSLLTELFTGLPSQTAHAQGEKGLFIADQINWENDTPELESGAEWRQEQWADLTGMTVALKYAENAEDKGSDISANQITAVKVKDGEEFKDDSTVSYCKNERNQALIDFTFKHCGEYRICYTPDSGEESYISLYVNLPEVGFYKTQTASEDTLLSSDELDLAKNSNEFYMIFSPNENQTVTLYAPVINWDESINTDDYLKCESVSQNIYKITVNPYSVYGTDGVDLAARCIVTDNDNKDDVHYTGYSTRLVYHTEKILWWADQFKEWGENGPEELEDAIEYQNESIWACRPHDCWISLKCGDSMVKAEQLTILDIQGNPAKDISIRNGSKDGFIAIHTSKMERYVLTYKEGDKIVAAREITINFPDIGFYKENTLSENAFLLNEDENDFEFQYGKYHNRTFYLLYRNEDSMSISDVEIFTYLRNADGEYELKQSDYISSKPLANNKGYELNVKENMEEEFAIQVNCKKTYTQEDGTTEVHDDSVNMLLKPNGLEDEPEPPKTEPPKTEPPKTEPPITEPPRTNPPITEAPRTNPPITEPPITEPPKTNPPITEPPKTDPPITEPPITNPPKTDPPKTNPPITDPPKTNPPKVGTKMVMNGITYQITSLNGGKKEVSYISGRKKAAKVTVPSTVTVKGTSYKVTAIADNAFAGNSKLTSVKLSNNIAKIGKSAFTRCAKLSSITIPKNVTQIGNNAFKHCKKLSKVTFKGTKIKKVGKNAFKNVSKKITIKVPKGKKAAYKKLLKKAGYKKTVK